MSTQRLDCEKVVNQYLHWLKDNVSVRNVQGACEITTPFLDRHNDYIQIFVEKNGPDYILTDDGYTLGDLKSSGLTITPEKRKKTLQTIVNGFGVQIDDGDRLIVKTTAETIAQKKHNLIQTILSVNDMFVMAEERALPLFKEDVAAFLDAKEIRYTPSFRLSGKSGFDHTFDFSIPKTRKRPERILRAINQLTKDATTSCIFSFRDVLEVRDDQFEPFVFANDQQSNVSNENIGALKNYGIRCVPWGERDNIIDDLAA